VPRTSAIAALRQAALRHDLSPSLVEAVAWRESQWNQNALSPKGARGVMQLMPGTARSLGVDARDLDGNVDGGAAYLAQMLRRFDGDIVRSLAAYNAGPQAVARYGGVPPYAETQAFVSSILDRLAVSATSPEVQR
jgi:soluble lytic murein transglycosylase-like protein